MAFASVVPSVQDTLSTFILMGISRISPTKDVQALVLGTWDK
jgi:hypothetical protein